MRWSRVSVIGAGLGVLAGCGVGDRAPDDASVDEFCTVQDELRSDLGGMPFSGEALSPGSSTDVATALRTWAEEMRRVGTPSGVPSDARDGFEFLVDSFIHVSAGDLAPTPGGGDGEDVDETDVANAEAFATYAADTCGTS